MFDMAVNKALALSARTVTLDYIGMPIGVAFVNEKGEPGWIGNNPDLKIRYGSLRGYWLVMCAEDEEK